MAKSVHKARSTNRVEIKEHSNPRAAPRNSDNGSLTATVTLKVVQHGIDLIASHPLNPICAQSASPILHLPKVVKSDKQIRYYATISRLNRRRETR